jgi:hypothetical protein
MKKNIARFLTLLALVASPGSLFAGTAAYNAAVLANNPLLFWTFDEATGPAVEQVNGLATAALVPTGTATRGPSTTTSGGAGLGSAAVFDGVAQGRFQATDVVPGAGPGADFIASQRWAVEFWVNLGGTGPTYISEMYGPAGSVTNNPSFIAGFTSGLEMFTGGGRTSQAAPVPISAGTWHHVVGAFYGNSSGFADNLREIYVDGALALSDTTSNFSAGHGLNQFSVGNAVAPADNAAILKLDEYAIYELPGGGLLNDQLFVESISQHYFTPVPEPSTGVLALVGIGVAAWCKRRRSK